MEEKTVFEEIAETIKSDTEWDDAFIKELRALVSKYYPFHRGHTIEIDLPRTPKQESSRIMYPR